MRTAAIIALFALLSGCATSGAGTESARWYAPATWFSHAPAATADKADAKEDAATKAAVKAAQKATHETAVALASAPSSRPVSVATDSNASAVALLDQAAGPIDLATESALRRTVAGLLSENAEVRKQAEAAHAKEAESLAEISSRLTKAHAASEVADKALRIAFERENALANELRSQRALGWILAALAVICGAAWLYVRFALGGLPMATGALLRTLREKHPEISETVTPIFDGLLNRHEQDLISKHAR